MTSREEESRQPGWDPAGSSAQPPPAPQLSAKGQRKLSAGNPSASHGASLRGHQGEQARVSLPKS